MVLHSWSFYFLTKIAYGFIKRGTDPISHKMGSPSPPISYARYAGGCTEAGCVDASASDLINLDESALNFHFLSYIYSVVNVYMPAHIS